MTSEFPMTFQDDAQTAKSKSNPKKSNIIPMSRVTGLKDDSTSSASGTNEFPMSQFGDAEHLAPARRASAMRYFVRGFLLTILAGLWVAIGTGQLNSESDEVEAIRAMIPGLERNDSAELIPSVQMDSRNPETNANRSQMQGQLAEGAEQAKVPLDLPQTLPQQLAYQTPQAPQAPQAQSAPETSASRNVAVKEGAPVLSEKVPPVPAAQDEIEMSENDVKKTARFLKQQQKQLLEMEDHLTSMIARLGDSELAEQQLKELEEQHRQAAAKLKERRAKLRQ